MTRLSEMSRDVSISSLIQAAFEDPPRAVLTSQRLLLDTFGVSLVHLISLYQRLAGPAKTFSK
jgi:hypothetical protein